MKKFNPDRSAVKTKKHTYNICINEKSIVSLKIFKFAPCSNFHVYSYYFYVIFLVFSYFVTFFNSYLV